LGEVVRERGGSRAGKSHFTRRRRPKKPGPGPTLIGPVTLDIEEGPSLATIIRRQEKKS